MAAGTGRLNVHAAARANSIATALTGFALLGQNGLDANRSAPVAPLAFKATADETANGTIAAKAAATPFVPIKVTFATKITDGDTTLARVAETTSACTAFVATTTIVLRLESRASLANASTQSESTQTTPPNVLPERGGEATTTAPDTSPRTASRIRGSEETKIDSWRLNIKLAHRRNVLFMVYHSN